MLLIVLAPNFANGDCTYGDISLVGGANMYEGTVEVCVNDEWEHDGWGTTDAQVVCRQLYNQTSGAFYYRNSRFRGAIQSIFLSNTKELVCVPKSILKY